MFETGDLLFVNGKGWISKGIKWITKSNVSHVGIIFNSGWIFETHAGQNARLNPLGRTYKGKDFQVYRPALTPQEKDKVVGLIERYDATPYSLLDIVSNAVLAWMKPVARRKAVGLIGRKDMMICSELVARILYEVNPVKFNYFADYEGLRPDGVLKLALQDSWLKIR